jgi:hypothetical protein
MTFIILASPGPSTDVPVKFLEDAELPPIAVLVESPQSRWALLRERVRRLNWRAVLGLVLLWRRAGPLRRTIRATYGMRNATLPSGRVTLIAAVNAPETFEHLRLLAPDVLVFSGTRIVRPATLQAIRAPVLNIHAGITPTFRGVHGGYWALWTGRTQDFGTMQHLVDPGVDTGPVLRHVRPPAGPSDSFVIFRFLQLAAAMPILAEVLHRLRQIQELPDPVPVTRPRRQWYHPTLRKYLAGQRHGVW